MTNAVVSSITFQTGLLERLFQRLDQDQSQFVGAEELAGVLTGGDAAQRARQIVVSHDQDRDGRLTLAELGAAKLGPETMSSLLSVQEFKAAPRAERDADNRTAVDELFARADLDGDGKLSLEEFDAERTVQFAQALDRGETSPQHMFGALREAVEDGFLSKDEIMVGRRLIDVADPVDLNNPDLDPELADRLKRVELAMSRFSEPGGEPKTPTDTAAVLGNAVRSADFTEALMMRMLRQLELGTGEQQYGPGGLSLTP
ncbi:EF-hand domain-containing protein [Devosia naphthalenivorans]|uniref:EF-hand domain-containing protein n=1 Tax=Devosia naphthalenivorans TaxID=2082392 RepID=UPI000D3D935F|nr:EF-hand domain-containing protein [Devosia naphthalenivorans]